MSSQLVVPNSEAAILMRLIQSKEEMSRGAAQFLLSLDFSPADVERMNFLAQRSQNGSLSAEETAELDSYLHVGNLLTVMQSKARVQLKTHEHPSASQ